MANTTATGGYLTQTAGPVEDIYWRRWLGGVFRALSGLPDELVRPALQGEEAPTPDAYATWLSFLEESRKDKGFAAELPEGFRGHRETYATAREREITVRLYAYGPSALGLLSMISDAFAVPPNRAAMRAAGVGFVRMADVVRTVDMSAAGISRPAFTATVTLRRDDRRRWEVLNFAGASGTITGNRAISDIRRDWKV